VTGLDILEDDDGQGEGRGHAGDGRGVRQPARNDAAEQAGDHGAEQRRQRDEQVKFLHFHG